MSVKKLILKEEKVNFKAKKYHFLLLMMSSFFLVNVNQNIVRSETLSPQNYHITVNSNLDGEITPDEYLTLREAIALINNTLTLEELSELEKSQVQPLASGETSRIEFNLHSSETTIQLRDLLPPIGNSVIIDGTTNNGYDTDNSPLGQNNIPQPVVAITPAQNTFVFRGLTLSADNITVRGLSIYGFRANNQVNQRLNLITPPGNIVITHQLKPKDFSQDLSNYERTRQKRIDYFFRDPLGLSYDLSREKPTQNIVIENNWLGFNPQEELNSLKSAFGIYIFNSNNIKIENNYITAHQGSGIITGRNAENSLISDNMIIANGIEGVPDAIRLEGNISNTHINNNLISNNQGSGIYLFKTQGSILIDDNQIIANGLREKRGGIYLMGNNHHLENNLISNHNGPGVVVTAYPQSWGNVMVNNRFSNIDGLSIDLVTRNQTGIQDYEIGDGVNPRRNSENRRQDTANGAINAPRFFAPYFYKMGERTHIDGIADPFSMITFYRVDEDDGLYGPLSQPIGETIADEEGRFQMTLPLQVGEVISAIALLPEYGTSEPARNAVIRSLE